MPKIQLVQSRLQAPSTTGQRFIQADTRVAEALQGAGQIIQQAGERRLEKQASASLFEMENDLRTTSREAYIDAQDNRLGKNALPDEESGYAGVYEDYNQTADKFISERISSLPAKYQQAAKERLTGISNGYRDRFAIHQSAQEAEHRKAVLASNLDNIKDDLYMDMRVGGGVDRISEGYTELEEIVKAESRGKDVSAFLAQTKADLYKQSILARSDADPHSALEMLKEESVLEALDPGQIETLNRVIDQKRVDAEAKQIISDVNRTAMSYEAQLELAQESTADPKVEKLVVSQINWQKTQLDNSERETQYNIMDETYDAVFAKQEKISPTTIDTDPQYAILNPQQKITVKSWLSGGKAGEMETMQREATYQTAKGNIIAGEWNQYDIMERVGVDFDVRDSRTLVKMAENREQTVEMSNAVAFELESSYHDVYSDRENRASTIKGIDLDIEEYRQTNHKNPDRKTIREMVKDNAEGFAKISFWRSEEEKALEEAYPTIGDPQYKYIDVDDDGRVSYTERQTLRYRESYPQASYRSTRKVYDLGEPKEKDGMYWFIHEGELKSFPADDKAQYDGYQRWLIEEGGK